MAFAGCGGGGSSNEPPPPAPPPPPPTAVSYSISVSTNPSSAVASVGEVAEATFTWSFSANPASSNATSYSVSSSTSGVQITGSSGSVAPGTSISTGLSFSCTSGGTTEAQITLSVGNTNETVTWSIVCTEEQIDATPLEDARVASNDAALATLVWRFNTTGDASAALDYEITSDSQRLQITDASGSAMAGTDVENALRYMCSEVGVHSIALSIRVGSATSQVVWSVTCTIEDIEVITASFFQGPLVEQIILTLVEDEWHTEFIPLFYQEERRLRLSTTRQTFLTISFETREESEFQFDLTTPNAAVPAEIEKVSATNLPPSVTGSRPNYTRRVVFSIESEDLTMIGPLQLILDPEDVVPQRDETNNTISLDLLQFESAHLPPFKLVLFPIVSDIGTADLTDIEPYIDSVYDLLPVGTLDVRIEAQLDVTQQEEFDVHETLEILWDRWLREADRDEFYHGIFTQTDNVELCGLAYVSANVALSGEIDPFCSANTIAHEIGHNLSLNHAPACGAEEQNPDPEYPYDDGSIGTESGWHMRKNRPVGLEAVISPGKVYDVMSYCLETFTSQYSYGKATDYYLRRFTPIVLSSKPPEETLAGFGVREGQSLVLSGRVSSDGDWTVSKQANIVRKPMQALRKGDFDLEVVHIPSGALLHREKIQPMEIDHGENDTLTWGARIPQFETDGISIQIKDKNDRVLLLHDLSEFKQQ